MRSIFGNNCAKGCFIYLFALALIVVVTSVGLGGLSARFGASAVQGNKPGLSVPSAQEVSAPQSNLPDVQAGGGDGSGGGLPPTPVGGGAPLPTIAPPPVQPQPQPQATTPPPPPAQGQGGTITGETTPPFYIVQPGDSVWLIANKFGVDMDELRALNNIEDNLIYPGQIIYLPSPNGSSSQPSAPGAPSAGADAGQGTGTQQIPDQVEGRGTDVPTMPNTGITSRKP